MADDSALPTPGEIATAAEFTRALQALRARSGLTIREVARAAKTPVATTGDSFSGRHLPLDRDQFARILAACGETDPARIEQWQAALVRARRLPGRRTGTPYRGLERFEAKDARWFFGREDVTELLAYLAGAPSTLPLLLIGPSGAGKSSLLRAGLLPRLRADAVELAADPAEVDGLVVVCDLTVDGVPELTARVAKLAAEGSDGAGPGAGRAAVIVDQFEAVFTLCADEGERRALIDGLCDLARTGLVVLALRADFYQQAIRYPGLLRAAQERHVVLGPMSAGQVRRAVVEPARLARTEVEAGLVELLLADLAPADLARADLAPDADGSGAHEPGALPMLSHALLAAWEHSHGGALTVADYLAGGGIKDALTRSAERAYESLIAGQQRVARRLFLRLVHVADDLPPSRAAVPLDELLSGIGGGSAGADAEQVLEVFIDERMITVDTGTARLTHDALLAGWPRLRSWIDESAEELRVRRRISSGALAWAETGREEAALWRGSQLAVAREWADDAEKRAALLPLAGEFVDASVTAGTARERIERRRTNRLRSIVAVLTVLVVAVAGLTAYAFSQRQAATSAEAGAIKAAAAAVLERDQADSREAAFVADQLRAQDPAAAAQLSVAADRIAQTPQATASLLDASGTSFATRIEDSASPVQAVALSPDRRLLVAAGADGTLRLWNVATPGHPLAVATLAPADKALPLYTAAFSPDGRVIAAAGAGKVVRLWAVSGSGSAVPLGRPLAGPTYTVYSITFSRDGRLLAAGSADGRVRLWDVADPSRPRPVGRPLRVPGAAGAVAYVESVAFSPDGRTLAAGTSVKTVWLWNVSRPAAPARFHGMPLTGPAAMVSGVAFSPSGKTLAASSEDNKVWLWSVHASRHSASADGTLAGATDWANAVAFSPDGRSLAEGTSDASVLVWSLATRAITATLDEPQPVTSVSWDGQDRIAASDADGAVALWPLPAPVLDTGNAAESVAYSPDGATLAVGGTSVQLWAAATHTLLATHKLPPRVTVNATAFNPAGTAVAAALSNGTVALLSGRTLAPLAAPFIVITGPGTAESVAFSPNGALLATGADDGSLRLFNVADPARPVKVARVRDSGDSVYTVAFAPDGRTVAAASVDDFVRLWRVTGGGGVAGGGGGVAGGGAAGLASVGPALGGLASYAIGLAFSPDSKILAVGSADKTVRLWDVAAPARPVELGAPLTGPSGYVWAAAFSPSGTTLAVGVTDGTVWLWNVAQPAHPLLIATLTGPADDVYSAAFSPSGAQLAATSFEGTVHLWDTSPAAARAGICGSLGQPLTAAEWSSYVPGVPYRAPCSLNQIRMARIRNSRFRIIRFRMIVGKRRSSATVMVGGRSGRSSGTLTQLGLGLGLLLFGRRSRRALAQDAGHRGAPDQDDDAVQAEGGRGGGAEGGGREAGRDREVAHRRGEQQRGGGRAGAAEAEETADQGRAEQEDEQRGRHREVGDGQPDLGRDQRDEGGYGREGGPGGGGFRAGGGQETGGGEPAGRRAGGQADRERQRYHQSEIGDDAARRHARAPGLLGQDRPGQGDRRDGGADQDPGRDGGLAGGHRGGRDRGDLARGQPHRHDPVSQRAGRHDAGDRPGQRGQHGDPDGDRDQQRAPGPREAAERGRVDRGCGGEHQDRKQHVDALVAREPGQRPRRGQAEDRRRQHGDELGVGGDDRSRARRRPWHLADLASSPTAAGNGSASTR